VSCKATDSAAALGRRSPTMARDQQMTPTLARRTPPPARAELVHQLRTVAAALPLLLTAPLYRRRHLRWGATPVEVPARMPGGDLLPHAQFRCTRTITIAEEAVEKVVQNLIDTGTP
jgi:hypothetical protein